MTYPTYTRQDLANFTGRPLVSFPEGYVTSSAFPQALLLFKMGTCLASLNDLNEDQKQLAKFAILSMADAIHLSAPYQTVLASPFNSESIGSYSYSRAAQAVSKGLPTGIGWFDIAIQDLSVCDALDGIPMSMGIDVFGAAEGVPQYGAGVTRWLTPAEEATSRMFGFDPAPGALPAPLILANPVQPGMQFTGQWDPQTTYVSNQAVQFEGSLYFTKTPVQAGLTPPNGSWELVVQGSQFQFVPITRADFEALPLPHPNDVLYIITD
ncbi:hypothetical protein SEA_MAGRITTE_24 [Microbacterium phage Magritte]|nr:hypothetical protein SEA_MAGRITTE_24 [Microbacterium phage Magritte]